MRWLYAIPSSATGRHKLATAYSRYLGLMSARISPLAAAASSSDPRVGSSRRRHRVPRHGTSFICFTGTSFRIVPEERSA
jgi:hypothetical protein